MSSQTGLNHGSDFIQEKILSQTQEKKTPLFESRARVDMPSLTLLSTYQLPSEGYELHITLNLPTFSEGHAIFLMLKVRKLRQSG